VLLPAGARTLLIGGQNAVAADGSIVGKGDLGAQSATQPAHRFGGQGSRPRSPRFPYRDQRRSNP
jgi:hypothetical protein